MDYDIVIVGGGHNGLTCGAYLQRAGLATCVIERREVLGGCATSEPLIPSQPGFTFMGGGTELLGFRDQPVYRDLELERHGLEILDCDPLFVMPFPNGRHITIHRSVERTAESIAQISPEDGEAYLRYHEFWGGFDELVAPFYRRAAPLPGRHPCRTAGRTGARPSLGGVVRGLLPGAQRALETLAAAGKVARSPKIAEMARIALMPARQYILESFSSPEMHSLMAFFAMQTKSSLDEPGSALGMVELPWSHAGGVGRARGGMGAVSEAIARAFEAAGGTIVRGAHVEEIVVRARRAVGVRTAGGETIGARTAVVAAISPQRTFDRLVAPEWLDARFLRRVRAIAIDNTGVFKAFYGLDEAPVFSNSGDDGSDPGFRIAAGMLCPSIAHADAMWADVRARRLPETIGWGWCTHTSTLDPSLAPPGKHTLGLHTWVPVELADGREWDEEARATMAMRLLDEYARSAPNARSSMTEWSSRTPIDYELLMDNPKGNMFHVDFVPHQTFGFRPLPELSDYRTPIAGLYLSGAGTHPGPAVTGLPGHNTAQAVLSDR